ncbi:MAG TPA: oligopeptide/dipeptide ABC transporter ATP-binding protein [Symbiobacteriaceae bacterium]
MIADEPTTALDVVVQDRILQQISALQRERKMALVFVTHDIAVVADLCRRAMVMYAGKIAEIGTTRQIFKTPCHPYTMGLLAASPSGHHKVASLISIPGYPPDLTKPPEGCLRPGVPSRWRPARNRRRGRWSATCWSVSSTGSTLLL